MLRKRLTEILEGSAESTGIFLIEGAQRVSPWRFPKCFYKEARVDSTRAQRNCDEQYFP